MRLGRGLVLLIVVGIALSLFSGTASAFDTDSLSLDQSKDVSAIADTVSNIGWRSDGSKAYLVDHTEGDPDICAVSVSTPWEVSSIAGSSCDETFSGGPLIDAQDIVWRDNGEDFYVTDTKSGSTDTPVVYQFSVSSAWDITTVTSNQTLSVSGSQTPGALSLDFRPDGSTLYLGMDSGDNTVREYALSTPWDLATASLTDSLNVDNGVNGYATGLHVEENFLYVGFYFTSATSEDRLDEYELGTSWDISTGTFTQKTVISGTEGVEVSLDQGYLYTLENQDNIKQYTFDVPPGAGFNWDLRLLDKQDTPQGFAEDQQPIGFYISDEGDKLFMTGLANQAIFEYDMNDAWTVNSNLQYAGRSLSTYDGSNFTECCPSGLGWSSDGHHPLYAGRDIGHYYKVDLSNSWNFADPPHPTSVYNLSADTTDPTDVWVDENETRLFVADGENNRILKYTFTGGEDLDNAPGQLVQAFSLSSFPRGVFWHPTGNQMLTLEDSEIHSYDAGTAWDLSTLTLNYTVPVEGGLDLYVRNDGRRVYTLGGADNQVFEYRVTQNTTADRWADATTGNVLEASEVGSRIEGIATDPRFNSSKTVWIRDTVSLAENGNDKVLKFLNRELDADEIAQDRVICDNTDEWDGAVETLTSDGIGVSIDGYPMVICQADGSLRDRVYVLDRNGVFDPDNSGFFSANGKPVELKVDARTVNRIVYKDVAPGSEGGIEKRACQIDLVTVAKACATGNHVHDVDVSLGSEDWIAAALGSEIKVYNEIDGTQVVDAIQGVRESVQIYDNEIFYHQDSPGKLIKAELNATSGESAVSETIPFEMGSDNVARLEISDDGDYLVAMGASNVTVFDTNNLDPLFIGNIPSGESLIDAELSSDNQRLVGVNRTHVWEWDTSSALLSPLQGDISSDTSDFGSGESIGETGGSGGTDSGGTDSSGTDSSPVVTNSSGLFGSDTMSGVATGLGVNQTGARIVLAGFLIAGLMIAGAAVGVREFGNSGGMGAIAGATAGTVISFGLGLLPLWFLMVLALVAGALILVRT